MSQQTWDENSTEATTSSKIKQYQPQSSLPESEGRVKGGLFLGRIDQGLIGNAESTHVNRPKGKAPIVPKWGTLQQMLNTKSK